MIETYMLIYLSNESSPSNPTPHQCPSSSTSNSEQHLKPPSTCQTRSPNQSSLLPPHSSPPHHMQHQNHYHPQQNSPPSSKPTMSLTPMGLARYGSAPGSFLSSLVDPDGGGRSGGGGASEANLLGRSRFFAGDSPCLTSESSCKAAADLNSASYACTSKSVGLEMGLDRSTYCLNDISVGDLAMSSGGFKGGGGGGGGGVGSSPLFRHSSSPAGFLSHLMVENGFSVTRGGAGYSQSGTDAIHVMANRRLKSQLSFSSRQDSLSHISEISSEDAAAGNIGQTYMASNFQIGSWDDSNSIAFSAPSSKRGKDNNGDIIAALSNIDSPTYSLSKTSLEMANVENLFQIQQDSVPCKIRAKRGCATHPRSIAERERRTRISEKLRKLQELVPNMDKQTSTADMLDLAVQHIKGLQSDIQKLNQESTNCTCSASKQEMS